MKDLSTLSTEELKDFFSSFDWVLCDVDGVLWNVAATVPGAPDAIKSLTKISKKTVFVSNNTIKTSEAFVSQFKKHGFDVEKDDIVTPALTMVSCLKKHDLGDKKVFVVGMDPLKTTLKEAGFQLVENGPEGLRTLEAFVSWACDDSENVGAVVSDSDLNVNSVNLQKAITFLRKPDVLFLIGATDVKVPIGSNRVILGPGIFHIILERMTGRKGMPMAKPSPYLNEHVLEKYKIDDVSRVLFVGDSVPEDMGFATTCGYKKLLVLSGLSNKETVEKWEYPEEFKPDFYADSLKTVHDSILRVFGNSL